ncbi:MAG: hypothetical protein H7644_07020 [Candidatus Heimdallarchaeota archaeon]|nr:hypothetical protein [Candidatus Heimdallarchaeota archaeon]MCK5143501.1 hypothetical protein [Candidatus Heimdallarchaeota archaeon]
MVFTNQRLVELTDKKLNRKQTIFALLTVLNVLIILGLFFVGFYGFVIYLHDLEFLALLLSSISVMILFFVITYFLVPYNAIITKEVIRRKTGSETIELRYDKLKKHDDKEIKKRFLNSLVYLIAWILLFAGSLGLAFWAWRGFFIIAMIFSVLSLPLPILLGAYILPKFIGTLKELRLREKK